MTIQHFPSDAKPEAVHEALAADGCAVIDGLAPKDQRERLMRELGPYLEARAPGPDEFAGHQTRRIGGLIARSPTARELVASPLVLGTVEKLLADATSFHVHLTQIIAIGPGESAQRVHRDQWAFDFFPFPKGYEVQCNTLWALTDFTEENGATRVIPGSHLHDDKLEYRNEDTEPAEMEAGSVLLYTGALYHGGGANRSDAVRIGANITYARSWLRQEENQYLSVPPEVLKELPVEMLRLIGYARGAYALGYVDDLRDPLELVRPDAESTGFGSYAATRKKLKQSGAPLQREA